MHRERVCVCVCVVMYMFDGQKKSLERMIDGKEKDETTWATKQRQRNEEDEICKARESVAV